MFDTLTLSFDKKIASYWQVLVPCDTILYNLVRVNFVDQSVG